MSETPYKTNKFSAAKALAAIFVMGLICILWQVSIGIKSALFFCFCLGVCFICVFFIGKKFENAPNNGDKSSKKGAANKQGGEGFNKEKINEKCLKLQYALMLLSPDKPVKSKLCYALNLLSELLPNKIFALFVLENNELTCSAAVWPNKRANCEPMLMQEGVIIELLAKIKSCLEIKKLKEPYYFDRPLPFAKGSEADSGLLAPLLIYGRFVGVIAGLNAEAGVFLDEEKFILSCFCRCLALIIDDSFILSRADELRLADAENCLAARLYEKLPSRPTELIEGWGAAVFLGGGAERSGDFNFFIKLSQSKMLVVAGHTSVGGLRGAMFINNLRLIISCLSKSYNGPAQLLSEASAQISQYLKTDIFASAAAVEINSQNREITIADAGFTKAIINRPKSGFAEIAKTEEGVPLGLVDGFGAYVGCTVRLLPGDGILIYSEGALEYLKPQNDISQTEELRLIFDNITASQSAEALLNDIAEGLGLNEQTEGLREDCTLIYLRSED